MAPGRPQRRRRGGAAAAVGALSAAAAAASRVAASSEQAWNPAVAWRRVPRPSARAPAAAARWRRRERPRAAAAVTVRASAGDEVGGLVLEERLGAGSSGTTWRARPAPGGCALDLGGEGAVAVKLLRLEDGWGGLDKLEREASVLGRLEHSGIPRYYGSVTRDRPDGRDFGLVSSLVRGRTLEALVAEGGWRAEVADVRGLAVSLLETSAYLAACVPPVVHRDIKPANVVMERRDGAWRTFLVDFGAAVLGSGRRETAVGTFGFMAPETFGQVFTPKSDLYAIGATLLFAVTGLAPGAFPQERLRIQFRDALAGTPWEREEPWLQELLDRLLAPAPEDRFASAAEALRFLRTGREATAAPPGADRREAAGALPAEDEPLEELRVVDLRERLRAAGLPVSGNKAALVERYLRASDGLPPPRGSALRAVRRGLELRVLLPPPTLGASLPTGVFAVAWTAFTAFWTGSVLAAGAPVMALFSLPFWGVGGSMLRDTLRPLLRGALQLSIGRDSWRLERDGQGGEPIAEGRTADLHCRLETSAVVNGREVRCLLLQEGLLEQRCGEGLQPVEHEWLVEVISEHLRRCRAEAG